MYDECRCIYCEEDAEQKKIDERNERLARLEADAMLRLLNPEVEEEEEEHYYEDEDYDYCDICCTDDYAGESHYHCGECGQICGMMGHKECDPYEAWAWCLERDLYGY
jgi:hypothetical protein